MPQITHSSDEDRLSAKAHFSYLVTINWQKPLFIFALFLFLTLLLYFPTAHSGFVTDVTGGIERIKNQAFSNIFNSFGFPALNQISILGFYGLYHLFGLNGLPWYIAFCSIHAINGYLSFSIFKNFFAHFDIEKAVPIAFFGSLLFIVNPYQSEVLVWCACLNYLLITAFTLLCLKHLLTYLQTENLTCLYYLHGVFVLALFTFELSLMLPFLCIVFYSVWVGYFKNTKRLKILFSRITIPQMLLLGGYFTLNKLLFGNWVGHYGAGTHLQFSPIGMANTLMKYLLKQFFFVRSYAHSYKEMIFNFCDKYGWILLGLLLLGGLVLLFYNKSKENISKKASSFTAKQAISISLIAGFILSVFPVLNLYFYWIQQSENDRYGYLASIFGLMLLAFILFQLAKTVRYLLLSFYLISSVFLLIQTNQNWKNSTIVFNSLLEDFRWYDKENIVILNVPDNYNGVYMFRIIGKGSGFKDALENIHEQALQGKIWEVAQYNMTLPTDGVKVEKLNPQQLKITFNQWGNWFWRNGVGVGPTHKRTAYDVQFKGQFYLLDLKESLSDVVFIYQDGGQWRELIVD